MGESDAYKTSPSHAPPSDSPRGNVIEGIPGADAHLASKIRAAPRYTIAAIERADPWAARSYARNRLAAFNGIGDGSGNLARPAVGLRSSDPSAQAARQ